jgi:hypothetical protein
MKIPKPRVNDVVETLDLSKMFGRVIRIWNNREVIVNWENGNAIEKIKDLALVKRRYR